MDSKAIKNLIQREVAKVLREQFENSGSGEDESMSEQAGADDGVDYDAINELVLYITNDGQLYTSQVKPILANLKKKKAKGVYDPEKAVTLWMYLATAGAKKYMKEFGSATGRIQDVFPKSVRLAVARELRDSYEEELQSGLEECSTGKPTTMEEQSSSKRECEICGRPAKGHSSEARCAEHCSEEGEDRRVKDKYPVKDWSKKKVTTEQQSKWYADELSDMGSKKYRINFGNGQVSNTFKSLKAAEAERDLGEAPKGHIEFRDPDTGEWFNVKWLREQNSRMPGDKLSSDEDPMADFDTSRFYDDEDDIYDAFEGMDVMGPEGTETFSRAKHLPKATNPTPEELASLDRRVQREWEEDERAYDAEFGGKRLDWED